MSGPIPDALRARYRTRLDTELGALKDASRGTSTDRRPVELDQQGVGRLSRMDATQQQAMATVQEARRASRRTALEAALRRLDGPEFGVCEDCGDFIGRKRLDLDPTLRRYIGCAG